jgi:hypothetical protein
MSRTSSRLIAGVVVVLAIGGCRGNKNLTKANFDKIQSGMTLAEVQTLLGGPGETEGGDLGLAEGSGGAAAVGVGGDLATMSQPRSKMKTYKWGNDSRYIKVTFNGEKVAGDNYKSEHGLK